MYELIPYSDKASVGLAQHTKTSAIKAMVRLRCVGLLVSDPLALRMGCSFASGRSDGAYIHCATFLLITKEWYVQHKTSLDWLSGRSLSLFSGFI